MKEYANKTYRKFSFNIVIDKVKITYTRKGRRNNIPPPPSNLMCRVIFPGILANHNPAMYTHLRIFNTHRVYVDIGVRLSM